MQDELYNIMEQTNRTVFLTGRAGTGKTTFLQHFVRHTQKKFAVAAPTGIAAINAGGVTLHSLFGLPLKTYVPTYDEVDLNILVNQPSLLPHLNFRSDKLKLLRALEILIIDEVSMLRCDVLDMIDLALRKARRTHQKFGGLQILFIGDLYQLPPVVKSETEQLLYKYYPSPFFFEAKALEGQDLVTVTLNKVFRQSDGEFLNLLNAIRDNATEKIDFDLLNSRYDPAFESDDFYVHLASHNYMADEINARRLDELPEKRRFFKANITGDFKEHLFPNNENLALKIDAQVMFIRNDVSEEKRYYNGMLATVIKMTEEEITVLPQGEKDSLTIERAVWENKKYFINKENKIEEDVIGSYSQFPLKLAWAVTIHKSQGLTFDKVIIDAGKSFSSGQVYVALSRCRTLEGIVLKSKIPPHAIKVDNRIHQFQNDSEIGNRITEILETEKYEYGIAKLLRTLELTGIKIAVDEWAEAAQTARFLKDEETRKDCENILKKIIELHGVYEKFSAFAKAKLKQFMDSQTDWGLLESKSKGAVDFFYNNVKENILLPVQKFYSETKGTKGLKGYNKTLKEVIDYTVSYLYNLQKIMLIDVLLFTKNEDLKIKTEVSKKPTHVVTFQLFEEGKTVKEIAAVRELAMSTILGHLALMAKAGVLEIEKLFSDEKIKIFKEHYPQPGFESLTEWKQLLPNDFDFNEIKILLNHFNYKNEKV